MSCCSLWLWGRRKLSGMWKLLSPPLCCYSLRVRCNVSTQLFPSLHSYTITRPINQSVHVCVCVCAALWGCLVLLDQKLKATWVFLCLSSVLTSLLCCTTKQGEQTSSITAWKPVWLFSRQKSCCSESGDGLLWTNVFQPLLPVALSLQPLWPCVRAGLSSSAGSPSLWAARRTAASPGGCSGGTQAMRRKLHVEPAGEK